MIPDKVSLTAVVRPGKLSLHTDNTADERVGVSEAWFPTKSRIIRIIFELPHGPRFATAMSSTSNIRDERIFPAPPRMVLGR
jgi:hypothetical protein